MDVAMTGGSPAGSSLRDLKRIRTMTGRLPAPVSLPSGMPSFGQPMGGTEGLATMVPSSMASGGFLSGPVFGEQMMGPIDNRDGNQEIAPITVPITVIPGVYGQPREFMVPAGTPVIIADEEKSGLRRRNRMSNASVAYFSSPEGVDDATHAPRYTRMTLSLDDFRKKHKNDYLTGVIVGDITFRVSGGSYEPTAITVALEDVTQVRINPLYLGDFRKMKTADTAFVCMVQQSDTDEYDWGVHMVPASAIHNARCKPTRATGSLMNPVEAHARMTSLSLNQCALYI